MSEEMHSFWKLGHPASKLFYLAFASAYSMLLHIVGVKRDNHQFRRYVIPFLPLSFTSYFAISSLLKRVSSIMVSLEQIISNL